MNQINKIRFILSEKKRKFIVIIIIMSFLLSIIETIGITAIMPFISMLSNPEIIMENKYLFLAYTFFKCDDTESFILLCAVILIIYYIFRAIYSIIYMYVVSKFSYDNYYNFSTGLFGNYIKMSYIDFTNRNSSILTKSIINESFNTMQLIQQYMIFLCEVLTIILLYSILIFIDIKMTLVLSIILLVKALLLTKIISKIMKRQGVLRNEFQNKIYKMIGQTFGNFKFIKLKSNESNIINVFKNDYSNFTNVNIRVSVLNSLPRNILETLGFIALILIIIYIMISQNDTSKVIPIITMYALALYRILPAVNKILSSYNIIMFHSKALDIIYDDLVYKTEKEGSSEIDFLKKITLKKVTFCYEKKNVLNAIDIVINKNDKIAFVGKSGSGKSTLVDLIIGVNKLVSGEIFIDDEKLTTDNVKSWRKKIGYIPQSIYLFDGTIRENMSYGEKICDEKIINVLKQARIYEFLIKELDGLDTKVGEGGIKLSGGQKQRIGIARALCNNPDILVLDEATSALDEAVEKEIMDEIYDITRNKTLIIIAHRISTISKCDKIYTLKNGEIINVQQ